MGAGSGRLKGFFHYETVQIVRIRNVRVSLIHMLAQLAIVGYIVGYGLVYKKAYQATGQVVGSADIKVKGVGYTNHNQSLPWYGPNATAGFHVYDSYDLVMPAMEENALFVTTNMWVTKNQTREVCPSYNSDNKCKTDADCVPLAYVLNGRQTGINGSCRINQTDPEQLWPVPRGGFCDVYAWCPTELEMFDPAYNSFVINGVSQFTVFIRMNVNYPKFGITLDNTAGSATTTNFTNLWTLEEMVNLSGWAWSDIQRNGTMLGMNAVWNCDFDKAKEQCAPSISFVRLDDPTSHLSSGYNFRSIEYMHDKYGARQLTKHYGVRLLVMISGIGSKFDFAALFTAIGAGIGLLSVATLVADFIATNLLANKAVYKQAKYKEVEVADEEAAAALAAANAGETTGVMIGSSSSAAAAAAAAPVTKGNQGVNNPDLTTPLRGGFAAPSGAGQKQKRDSDGKLHIAERYADSDEDDDDQAESWGRAHYSKR